jgi:creatinine amidohydrolase
MLGELNWPEVARYPADTVLAVPLGSTEQHGPHLPLSTDTDVAVALCRRLAAVRPDVVVAPELPYGSSGEHAGFAGTLSIGQAALEHLLVELVRSATDTFADVLLVSGHGGNAEPLRRAEATLRGEGRNVLAWLPQWNGDAHAGRAETSLQLALRPWVVAYEKATAGNTRPLAQLLPELQHAGVRAVSPNGVLGDPTGASTAEGNALLDELVADLRTRVEKWQPPCAG